MMSDNNIERATVSFMDRFGSNNSWVEIRCSEAGLIVRFVALVQGAGWYADHPFVVVATCNSAEAFGVEQSRIAADTIGAVLKGRHAGKTV